MKTAPDIAAGEGMARTCARDPKPPGRSSVHKLVFQEEATSFLNVQAQATAGPAGISRPKARAWGANATGAMLHGKTSLEVLELLPILEQIEGNGIGSIFRLNQA